MLAGTQAAAARIAGEERVGVAWQRLYGIEPVFFTPALVELCAQAVEEISGTSYRMPSVPLHDAVAMVQAGIPTAMMFVQSLRRLSHTREEDTCEEHLVLAARTFDRLADKVVAWILNSAKQNAEL